MEVFNTTGKLSNTIYKDCRIYACKSKFASRDECDTIMSPFIESYLFEKLKGRTIVVVCELPNIPDSLLLS